MTLQDKEAVAMARMRDVLEQYGVETAVGWTGGKDSTVVLALWRRVLAVACPQVAARVLNVDTGCKFPEVLAFRDQLAREWALELHIVCPEIDLKRYPLAVDPVRCCADLKVQPVNAAIKRLCLPALLTGVRADENPDRSLRPWLEAYTDPEHVRAAPLLEWTEMDIWTFLVREDIPWCGLYDQGYRSLGCMPCTQKSGHGERSGRDQRKEERMGQLRSLGYF